MLIRQILLLALSAAGAWLIRDHIVAGAGPAPLWVPALMLWAGQTMFWFGWFTRDLKLLAYLAGAWIGVMASVGVMVLFIGLGTAAAVGEDQSTIRAALAAVLLLPILLLPRFRPVWPGAELPSNLLVHAVRSVFVAAQFAGVGLLIWSQVQDLPTANSDAGKPKSEVTAPRAD